MKRRKRKRSSKTANPCTPKIPVDGEKAASPFSLLYEAADQTHSSDELIAAVETETPASPSTTLAGSDYMIDLGDEFIAAVETETPTEPSVVFDEAERQTPPRDELIAAVETEKPAEPSAALAGADRRIHPRYEFTAAVEVIAAESGARIETRVRNLSQQGCYVDTSKPLPQTRAISAHGALILISAQVYRGQRLTLSNVQTKAALECIVAHIDRRKGEHAQVGVEFTLPNPVFWHVAFPPKDWTPRHPDAKALVKTDESS